MKIVNKISLFLLLCACAAAVFASETVTSYSSPVTAGAFFRWGDTLWVATSGGLQIHDLKTGATNLISNSRVFPDLFLTSLCRDDQGNLWMGSRNGYLYKRTPRGQFTTFSNYRISGWGIVSLYVYDGLIVVGSNRGVSLFDPVKGVALRNATSIANFANPRVNTITSFMDTLFLGCNEGIAYLDSLDVVPLSQRNLYYPGIWKVERTREPVVSFVNAGNFVTPASTPATMFRDVLFTTDSGWICAAGQRWARVFGGIGSILTLYNEDDRRLWIGTDETFYFSYDGEAAPAQYRIGGFTLRRASRVMVAPDGNVWFLPMLSYPNVLWYHGIYRFNGMNWYMYNDYTHPDYFGYIGDGEATAITAGYGGAVWAGTWGGSVKHIEPARNTVGQLITGYGDFKNFNYGTDEVVWSKVDALAMDTSGYLWLTVYDHNLGSLICYDQRYHPVSSLETIDPVRARYRRFFPEWPLKSTSVPLLSVDGDNRIFFYHASLNQLAIIRHGGNPLAKGVVVDSVYTRFGVVSAMKPGDDGATYIVGSNGLVRFAAGSLEMEVIDKTLTNVSGLAVQGDVVWLGTHTNGVLRYDLGKEERKWINESTGLPSNVVVDVAIDKKDGRLWVVTDVGVSQVDVGRPDAALPQGSALRAFPNTFSVSGKTRGVPSVTFAGLKPRSSVSVYTVNGTLVAKTDAEYFTDNEWRAAWTPKRTLTPGTYIAVAKPSGQKAKIILKP